MNTELTCDQCRDALPDYVAGTLPLATSTAVTRHLAHCAACQHELVGWRSISVMTQQADAHIPVGGPAAKAALWTAIEAHLPTESPFVPGERFMDFDHRDADADLVDTTGAGKVSRDHYQRRPRVAFLAPVAVLLLIALVAGVFALHPTRKTVAPGKSSKTATSIPPTPTSSPALGITNLQFTGAALLSSNNIWAVGYGSVPKPGVTHPVDPTNDYYSMGAIVHYTGRQWQIDSTMLYPYAELYSISMDSPDDGWAVGAQGINGSNVGGSQREPFMLHYTGGHWTDVHVSAPGVTVNQVQMLSADAGWAFGGTITNSVILHYTNGAWQRSDFAPASSAAPTAMLASQSAPMSFMAPAGAPRPANIPILEQAAMVSATEGYAIGVYQNESVVWHYSNGAWVAAHHDSFADTQYASIGVNAANDVWVLADKGRGNVVVIHYDGQAWAKPQPINAAAEYPLLAGAQWLKVVGDNGLKGRQVVNSLLHEQGGKWILTPLPNPNGYENLVAIASQSDGSTLAMVLASQQANNIGTSEYAVPYLLRYVNGTWNMLP